MTERPQGASGAATNNPPPHIGAFVLETLTLGMYGDPRHTLREYIQNSFDSIRAAQRIKFLTDRGRVTINMEADAIIITDNGLGVPAAQAWKTLTSVGASKKDRQRDAGFRGIGRLGGMAYCDELLFCTTFPGETTTTTIRFDCQRLLEAMDPDEGGDMELSNLLATAIHFEQQDDANPDDHFFEVRMNGLQNLPEILSNADNVRDYLSETVPVEFDPAWERRTQIENDYKSYFGTSLETVDIFVIADDNTTQVYKPYGEMYEYAKGTLQLRDITFYAGDDNRYWGWIGRLNESAAVTDWRTRGLRLRVKNIQVDGTDIFENLFTQVKPSYGRFSAYYVGEVHVDPERIIPNARRDGFEETDEWISIRTSLIDIICQPLAAEAYQTSKEGRTNVGKVVEDIDSLVERSQRLADNSRSTYDQVVDLMNNARRLRRRASAALKLVGDFDEVAAEDDLKGGIEYRGEILREATRNVENVENQARMLIGRFLGEEERIEALKARLRQEIVQELLDVVNAFVDYGTYQKIRRRLLRAEI